MKSQHLVAALVLCCIATAATATEPLQIGSRLELFVDDYVIDKLEGEASLQLHRPEP